MANSGNFLVSFRGKQDQNCLKCRFVLGTTYSHTFFPYSALWFLAKEIWCIFLCPKMLFFTIFWYLDWIEFNQQLQNAWSSAPIIHLYKFCTLFDWYGNENLLKIAYFSQFWHLLVVLMGWPHKKCWKYNFVGTT